MEANGGHRLQRRLARSPTAPDVPSRCGRLNSAAHRFDLGLMARDLNRSFICAASPTGAAPGDDLYAASAGLAASHPPCVRPALED